MWCPFYLTIEDEKVNEQSVIRYSLHIAVFPKSVRKWKFVGVFWFSSSFFLLLFSISQMEVIPLQESFCNSVFFKFVGVKWCTSTCEIVVGATTIFYFKFIIPNLIQLCYIVWEKLISLTPPLQTLLFLSFSSTQMYPNVGPRVPSMSKIRTSSFANHRG